MVRVGWIQTVNPRVLSEYPRTEQSVVVMSKVPWT